MNLFFERHGYDVHFIARHEFDKTETFEEHVLERITKKSRPFLTVADFGDAGIDGELKFQILMLHKKVKNVKNNVK